MTGDDIVVVDDLSNDPLVWAAARHRLGAALGVPLSAADKVVGHRGGRPPRAVDGRTYAWPEHDLASLVTLAPDIAAAIEHAQLYDRERTMVQQLQELDWPAYQALRGPDPDCRASLSAPSGFWARSWARGRPKLHACLG